MSSYLVPIYSKTYLVLEIAPKSISMSLGVIHQSTIIFGIFLSSCLHNNEIALYSVPIAFSVLQLVLMFTLFKVESPTFLWKSQQRELAISLVNNLYFEGEMTHEEIEEVFLEVELNESGLTTDFKSLFKKPKYRKALVMGLAMIFLHRFIGAIQVLEFSLDQCSEIAVPIEGFNFASTLPLIFLFYKYPEMGNRRLLQIGGLGMSISLGALIALTELCSCDYYSLIPSGLFVLFYQSSIGPLMWIYCADVLSEKGLVLTTSLYWVLAAANEAEPYLIDQQTYVLSFHLVVCLILVVFSTWGFLEKHQIDTY